MENLRKDLAMLLTGRTCVVGVGNCDLGDDGVGVEIAERLAERGIPAVMVAGPDPERFMGRLTDGEWDHVLFVDAVGFGGEPGAVIVMDAADVGGRFPQVSTHKISLGTLAGLVEREGAARVSLLGIQPQTLESGAGLSTAVRDSAEALVAILSGVLDASRDERTDVSPAIRAEGSGGSTEP
jgi:hydrogenase maturation protease